MPTLYIVKTGSTFDHIAQSLGDFEQWIAEGLHPPELLPAERLRLAVIDAPSCRYAALHYPEATDCAGVVISGSHAMVTDHAPWMQDLQSWLRPVCDAGVPVLGICFGHQILAHLLGGEVGPHPAGLELGTIPVAVQADVSHDPLWRHMPGCFDAQAVHYQSVRRLPPRPARWPATRTRRTTPSAGATTSGACSSTRSSVPRPCRPTSTTSHPQPGRAAAAVARIATTHRKPPSCCSTLRGMCSSRRPCARTAWRTEGRGHLAWGPAPDKRVLSDAWHPCSPLEWQFLNAF